METQRKSGSTLKPASSRPENLVSHVAGLILMEISQGTLRPLDQLPSEREFAERLAISRSTVTAAYAELEQRGVVKRLQGKGAFICAVEADDSCLSWSGKIAGSAYALDEPVLELLARRCSDNVLYPLSAGTPSLEIFPAEAYRASADRVSAEQLPSCLAVAPTEGQWRMRQALGQWIGVPAPNVMIVAGAQEGIDLLARCLVEPGDYAVIDSPTYPGAIQSFRSAGARLLKWSTDWSLSQLEDLLLRFKPKFIFTMPTFHNPTGKVMTLKTRLGLLDLAHRYKVSVVEDDVYSRSFFEGQGTPESLYKLDTFSQVIAISTFSKLLAPGLRIGWLTAPLYMVKQLSLVKMRSSLFTAGFSQMVLADMLQNGAIDQHLLQLRKHHGTLCRIAVNALQPAVDAGLLKYSAPAGSLYLWCKVLLPLDMERLHEHLGLRGVSVAPGKAFDPESGRKASSYFRVCFTATTGEKLAQGLDVLCRTLQVLATNEEGSKAPVAGN